MPLTAQAAAATIPASRAHQPDPSIQPGPRQHPHSANDQHDAYDEEKHASARQSVASERSPEVPRVPTVETESPDSDDNEHAPGGTHEHGSEYQLPQTPVGHIARPWLHFTRRLGHDHRPVPAGLLLRYARPYRIGQERSVRSARRSRRTIATLSWLRLGTSTGSRLPARSRGTCTRTGPTSVLSTFSGSPPRRRRPPGDRPAPRPVPRRSPSMGRPGPVGHDDVRFCRPGATALAHSRMSRNRGGQVPDRQAIRRATARRSGI